MKHIESCIRDANLDLKDLKKVKNIAATYAILALMDSAVAEEAYAIVEEKK